MLKNTEVRINGYKNGKRTHIDITVKTASTNLNGKVYEVPKVPHFSDVSDIGFKNGLDGATSYNYYNWISNERHTETIA